MTVFAVPCSPASYLTMVYLISLFINNTSTCAGCVLNHAFKNQVKIYLKTEKDI